MIDRRGLMGGLGLAGLGLIFSSTAASAATSGKSKTAAPRVSVPARQLPVAAAARQQERIDLSGLPSEWAHRHSAVLTGYAHYLWGLKLRTISPAQVIQAHAKSKGSVWNELPPKQWWTRMGYTLRVADRVAMELGVNEVEVVSAYRSPAYNARCSGAAARSWHQANVALDVKFPVRASKVTAAARNLRDRGLFKGGVGGYRNFTHIDTRGENTNW